MQRTWQKWALLFFLTFSSQMARGATQSQVVIQFPSWQELSQTELGRSQKQWLSEIFREESSARLESRYEDFQRKNEAKLLAFFMITHVLSRLEIALGGESWSPATILLHKAFRLAEDRVFFMVQENFLKDWKQKGQGNYILNLEQGPKQGNVKFHKNSTRAGSLHLMHIEGKRIKAFEQIYTSAFFDFPRVQFNFYNEETNSGIIEIDLDAFSPWWFGVIPNFGHQKFRNSCILSNYKKFFEKFGNPGVEIKESTKIKE